MRSFVRLALLASCAGLPAAVGQTSCSPHALGDAAKASDALRHQLRSQATAADDPAVPPAIAAQLLQFKDALAHAADAAFGCTPASVTPEELQKTLATALRANDAAAGESITEAKGGKDLGAYGSGLAVQVFELFGTPRLFEVNFRYSVACGDDNLLMIYEAASSTAPGGWHRSLRWDAPVYNTVSDALGDFVLLTPLSGSAENPHWRYLVAHGHPGCSATPRPSSFTLDLLEPTADAGKPEVDWHFEHPYMQGLAVPRLATTEDTIEFRLNPATPAEGKPAGTAQAADIYRFHLTASGKIEPSPANNTGEGSTSNAGTPAAVATKR